MSYVISIKGKDLNFGIQDVEVWLISQGTLIFDIFKAVLLHDRESG